MGSATLSSRRILLFWLPLASTWLMMALEGPFLAAVIARLPQPVENLAAFGVAFAFAVIVESPVIMLLSASTALVQDRHSFHALRRFAYRLNVALTSVMVIVLIPPVFGAVMQTILRLPESVSGLVYEALALLLPWPAAIGYRRFYQGLLIRRGQTRLVAYGTVVRLSSMALTALGAAMLLSLRGVNVGAAALSAGVLAEALASRLMARRVVRQLRQSTEPGPAESLTQQDILHFYVPLALTSILAMAVQPMVTFFMGLSRFAIESLAVLPVINGLTFIFRSIGVSYQEVGIAMLGERSEQFWPLRNFAMGLAIATTSCLAIIGFTPLATFWFHDVSGLSLELTGFARLPIRILAPLPGLSVVLSFQRAILVNARHTRPITWATFLEVSGIALALWVGIAVLDLVGAVAAATALIAGRLASNAYLVKPCWDVVARIDRGAGRPAA